jgi:cytochrome c biogenesis protein CcmG, thiol:disulfide interchange protein DsbE
MDRAAQGAMNDRQRQWVMVGATVAVLVALMGAAWTVRDRFLPVEVGTRAPDFAASDLDGNPVRFADLRGEVVLLNIWATWCPPCREEMPSMQRLYDELGPQGLRIVAVSVDAPLGTLSAGGRAGGNVAAFSREYGLDFQIWHDPSGEVQRTYRTTGLPESFVIDRRGVIQQKVIGATEWDEGAAPELIRRLLTEG